MENVKKTKTRRVGNPKWIHIPSDIDVYFVKGNGDKSHSCGTGMRTFVRQDPGTGCGIHGTGYV